MLVFIVTISEQFPWMGNGFSVKAFSSREKAEKWVEGRIAELVAKNGLDPAATVDDWFVEISRDQTVQFDIVEDILS